MYKLTLTHSERSAIDWVGYRYWHGDNFYKMLWMESQAENEDAEWDDDADITFLIPEYVAWEISENILEDGLACFAPELCEKIYDFLGQIV